MKKALLFSISVLASASMMLASAISPGLASAQAGPVTIKIFSPQFSDRTLATNTFSLALEKKFNVKFEWTTSAGESTDAHEKRTLALASGDYPDMFMLVPWLDNISQIEELKYGQQGVLIPLNDLIDQYAPHIKAALASNADFRAITVSPDGKIWGLPELNECYHCSFPNKMWVNSSWLKKLNIPAPKTTEDFKNMLIAFRTKDANGNGKADEVLSGANLPFGTRPIPYLMNGFIYDDDHTYLMLNNGKVDTVANKQGWKDGLAYVKSLYDAGVIDPGAFTNNADAYAAEGNNATAELIGAGATLHPWQFTNCADNASPAYCKDYDPLPPLKGPNSAFGTYIPASQGGGSFLLTNKASKEAQIAAIQIADYLFTFDGAMAGIFGVKDVDWRDPKPGELANNQAVKPLYYVIPNLPPDNSNWGPAAQLYNPVAFRDAQVQSDKIYTAAGYEHRLQLATDLYKGSGSPNLFPFWNVWPDPTVADELGLMKQNITDYIESNQLAFVTGSKSLDKDWDAYVKGLNDLNLSHYLEIIQKEYDASTASSAKPAATAAATTAK